MKSTRIIRAATVLVISFAFLSSQIEAKPSAGKALTGELRENDDPLVKLQEKLRRTPTVRSQGIDATMKDGVVTLSGSVTNLSSARSAAEIAGSIPEVKSVVSQLIVNPPVVPDDEIVSHSLSLISEFEAADASRIQITSRDGAVKLSGRADSLMEKKLIESEISFIRGVKSITNQLEVRSKRDTNDEELTAIITALMENSAVLDGSNIEVLVKDRVVSLSGVVPSPLEKTTAVDLAGVPGVTTVNATTLTVGEDENREQRHDERVSKISDEQIAKTVKLAMSQHPILAGAADQIEVISAAGMVTLSGKVKRFSIKKAAGEIVTYTSGVQGIDNRIDVEWSDTMISDEEIALNVRKAVARDAYLDLADIIPRSKASHVHLYGMVDTPFEKARAGRIADAQPGVVHVANYLTVSDSFSGKSDEEIAETLRMGIELLNTAPHAQVSVDVLNGVPVFRGHVSTWFQWQSLLRMAVEAGATKPHIDVTVHHRPGGAGTDLYVPQ